MNVTSSLLILSTCLLAATAVQCTATPALPEVAAYHIDAPPVIDGKLDEPFWSKAPLATNFWKSDGSGPVEDSSSGQVAYDDNNLYISMHCLLQNQEEMTAAKSLAKDAMFGHDTVEIFLEPYADNAAYFHFAVNAVNGRFAAMNFGYAWANPWESATKIEEGAWNAEIKIPFASLATNDGKPSPSWRINLTRGATTWAPTFVRYHQPDLFGRFTGIDAPLEDYRWHTAVGEGNIVGDPSVILELYHNTGKTREIKYSLEVTSSEPNAKPVRLEGDAITLPPLTSKMVDVPLPAINKPGMYQVLVTVSEAASGRPLAYSTTSVEGLRPAQTVWDRSFYMSEARAYLNITCSGKSAIDATLTCSLQLPGKHTPLQAVTVRLNQQGQGVASFALKALPTGEYEVALKGKYDFKLSAVARPNLLKLIQKPGAVQYTDRGLLLRDGQPIFPFGVYYVRQGFPFRKGLIDEYAQAGFNTYPMEWGSADDFVNETRLQKARGVVPIVGINNSAQVSAIKYQGPQTFDAWEKATRDLVKEVSSKAGDNILAWYTWDEPPIGIWYDLTKRLHQATHQEDPYHPTMVVLNNPAIFKTYTNDATDILAVDPYPGFPGGRMRVVSDWMDAAIKAAPNKPVIAVLQAFYEPSGRMPTPEELRCMTYMSIVHGAKGVFYFSYNYTGFIPDHSPAVWQAMKDLAGEVKVLEPSLVANSADEPLIVLSGDKGIDFKICGDYLIAVNVENTPAWVTFKFEKGDKLTKSAPVFGEKRSISLAAGKITDSFAPYAVHIYKIK